MDPLLLVGVVALVLIALQRITGPAAMRPLRALARRRGLHVSREGTLRRAVGSVDGWNVTIRRRVGRGVDITLHGAGRIPRGLVLALERERDTLDEQSLADVRSGDEAFDARTRIDGDRAVALALLDRSTRALVSEAVHILGARVEGGDILLRVQPPATVGRIDSVLDLVVRLASALELDRSSLPQRLLRNASDEDEKAPVRDAFLRALLERFPTSASARRGAQMAEFATDDRVRVLGLIARGDKALRRLERLVGDRRLDEGARALALRHLVAHSSAERVTPLAVEALETGRGPLRIAAAEAAGTLRVRGAAPLLATLLDPRDPEAWVAACDALAAIGDTTVEGRLLDRVDDHRSDVALAAIRALGMIGGARTLERLRSVASSDRVDAPIRREAQAAEAAIVASRGNLGGGGGLTLSERADRQGELELVDADGGLSSVEDE